MFKKFFIDKKLPWLKFLSEYILKNDVIEILFCFEQTDMRRNIFFKSGHFFIFSIFKPISK